MQLTVKSGGIDELAQVDNPYNAFGFAHAAACLDRPLPDRPAGNAMHATAILRAPAQSDEDHACNRQQAAA